MRKPEPDLFGGLAEGMDLVLKITYSKLKLLTEILVTCSTLRIGKITDKCALFIP